MRSLLFIGLIAVSSVYCEDGQIDYSEMKSHVVLENTRNWVWNPPAVGGIGGGDVEMFDSSEHGVLGKPGRRATSCQCGLANRDNRRIVGGRVHRRNEYPFIAGVAHSHSPTKPMCGSTMVSPWHVLTAAHCTAGARSLVVTVGEYDRSGRDGIPTIINVRQIIDHEQYDPQIIRNDISLLLLERPIEQNMYVGLACLPTPGLSVVGQKVRIIGWGATRFQGPMTTVPQKVDLDVIDMGTCSRMWPNVLQYPAMQVCTHSPAKTACQGDSGGPVVWLDPETNRYTLVGIVSFGAHCQDVKPSVQTSVAYYLPWIYQKIQQTTPGQQTCTRV